MQLTIHSQNVNGLRSKIPEFIADVMAKQSSIVQLSTIYMLCETHLDNAINTNDIFPPMYSVHRCDRSTNTERDQLHSKERGGGVLIAVNNKLKSVCIGTGDHFGAEQIWILSGDNIQSLNIKPVEGQARAKFNFQAQSPIELSLNKGELIILTRQVDDNWFEGRIANRKGIFPVSYVDVSCS
ncbi:uncharacterized protein LOC116349628 [Contarinia nasturtii]|uniref:uncharacterized protein LOC116349628 n=1 Tax=Contarinia nasturtii TaxID=265458 RepID=UPI0012D47266|nr:uncharacterized protein LOC116349628 [Contarinia nasturtii]